MAATTPTNRNSSGKETSIEQNVTGVIAFVKRFFATHKTVFMAPADLMQPRELVSVDLVKPETLLFYTLLIFTSVACAFPLFSEPTVHTSLRHGSQDLTTFLQTHSFTDVLWFYPRFMITVLGAAVIVVLLFFGDNKKKRIQNWGVAAYLLVAFIDSLLVHYFIVLSVLKATMKMNLWQDYFHWRYHGELVFNFAVGGLFYPAIGMIGSRVKQDGWAVILFFTGLVVAGTMVVFFSFGRSKGTLDGRHQPPIPPTKQIPTGSPLPGSLSHDSSSVVVGDSTAACMGCELKIVKPVSDSVVSEGSEPDNFSIHLTAGLHHDSVVHFVAYRDEEGYWLRTSYCFQNSADRPVSFVSLDSFRVFMSLGVQALRQEKGRSKAFWFSTSAGGDESPRLEPNTSRVLTIEYSLTRNMYRYLRWECGRNRDKEHKVFMEVPMRSGRRQFFVNRQSHWDIRFD